MRHDYRKSEVRRVIRIKPKHVLLPILFIVAWVLVLVLANEPTMSNVWQGAYP